MPKKIAVIGECMIEVKPNASFGQETQPKIDASIGYGGDTINFCIYMSRLGADVDYVTALGDDPASDWLVQQWRNEGVGCQFVKRVEKSVPGLYLIETDETGERSFYYWRDMSPVRRLFDNRDNAKALFDELRQYEYIYFSGITLALFSKEVRERLFTFFGEYRKGGGKILFDNNYRPRQWNDLDEARQAFEQAYRHTDIALPSLDDELLLFQTESEEQVIERLQSWGIRNIILKKGEDGCVLAIDSSITQVAVAPVENVVDTTAAGDSFNAGFVSTWLRGRDFGSAVEQGSKLAALVVQHPGAVIPKSVMNGEFPQKAG